MVISRRLEDRWILQTADVGLRIVLADGDDDRARTAAAELAVTGVTPVLVSTDPTLQARGVEVIDPRDPGGEVVAALGAAADRQAAKRPMSAQEQAAFVRDPLNVAVAAVAAGRVDGCVAGASRPSADVARAALRIVGMAQGRTTLSSSFLLSLPDGRTFAYGDCAVVPEPDAQQLADIAAATADTFSALVGEEIHVALLSFSTLGSADHPSIDVVREAVRLIRAQRPDLNVDGEMQFDAAVMPDIASSKAPGSPTAGRSNVLIFPNLAAANIAYKITERLGNSTAYGPLLQGLAAPVNDLSRGCSAEDIVTVSRITAAQAMGAVRRTTSGGD